MKSKITIELDGRTVSWELGSSQAQITALIIQTLVQHVGPATEKGDM